MSYGTVVFEELGVILPIVSIALRGSATHYEMYYESPVDRTVSLGGWVRVHGSDGTVVLPRTKIAPVVVEAKAFIGFTVWMPVRTFFSEGAPADA